jgi:CRISPR-associated endonuclease Cas3-HD
LPRKPCAFADQGLQEHVDGVKRVAEEFIERSHLHLTVAKRMNYMSIPAKPEVVKDYMTLAATAHDLGKALKLYQDQFDEDCSPVSGRFSFYNHEVYSASILTLMRKDIEGALGSCSECLQLAIAAVLWHHHAMRVHSLDEKEAESLAVWLEKGGDFVGELELMKGLRVGNLTAKDVRKGLNSLYSWMHGGDYVNDDFDSLVERTNDLLSAFVLPLVLADYADSSKREKSEKGDFSKLVEDLLDSWGVRV